MSALRNLRQRFNKGEQHEDRRKDSKDDKKTERSSDFPDEIFEVIEVSEETKCSKAQEVAEDSQSCSSLQSEVSSAKWESLDERRVFEEQLNQLQEQLMIVMLENQTLKSEYSSSKTKTDMEKVKAELDYERHRNEILEKKLQISKKTNPDLAVKHKQSMSTVDKESINNTLSAFINSDDYREEPSLKVSKPTRRRFCHALVEWILSFVYTFLDDITDESFARNVGDPEGDPLSVKKLKENIKRFGSEAKPYVNTLKGISELLTWKSPPYTLIVFVVYMYSVWQGWFLPVFLLCFSFRLFINFLRYRGWNISFSFFETLEEAKDTEEKDLGVSEKLNLVMNVARKVQNVLGMVADSLEKIKSLLTWRHPEASWRLLLLITAAFVISCVLPTSLLFFYAGLGLGIKLFIINYIYNRFPHVRRKYDTSWRLWNELPTDTQFEKRMGGTEIEKFVRLRSPGKWDIASDTKNEDISMDDRTFCELFSLPDSECPLPGWHGGRRCTLINKEKSLTSSFRNGKLYLTRSFLCFERTKIMSPKNIVIPLADIVKLEKNKPYAWLPGGGMAIEIAVVGNDKPYIFGAIINRDEVLESILKAGCKAALSWSTTLSLAD